MNHSILQSYQYVDRGCPLAGNEWVQVNLARVELLLRVQTRTGLPGFSLTTRRIPEATTSAASLYTSGGTEDDNSRISSGKGNIPTLFDDPKDKILIDGEDGKIDSPREIIDRCVAGELFNCVMLWVHRLDDPVVATT